MNNRVHYASSVHVVMMLLASHQNGVANLTLLFLWEKGNPFAISGGLRKCARARS